jgi:hypothetical protein
MTTALASAGMIKRCGDARSPISASHRVCGQANSATPAATLATASPAAAALPARIRARRSCPSLRSICSVPCWNTSLPRAYPGWTASAFSAQNACSAIRNTERPPNQASTNSNPSRSKNASQPVWAANVLENVVNQLETTSGATPTTSPGIAINNSQDSASFVMLISASMLPAMPHIERCLGLDASSSMSPKRGSISGVTPRPVQGDGSAALHSANNSLDQREWRPAGSDKCEAGQGKRPARQCCPLSRLPRQIAECGPLANEHYPKYDAEDPGCGGRQAGPKIES